MGVLSTTVLMQLFVHAMLLYTIIQCATAEYGASGAAVTACTVSGDFFSISMVQLYHRSRPGPYREVSFFLAGGGGGGSYWATCSPVIGCVVILRPAEYVHVHCSSTCDVKFLVPSMCGFCVLLVVWFQSHCSRCLVQQRTFRALAVACLLYICNQLVRRILFPAALVVSGLVSSGLRWHTYSLW